MHKSSEIDFATLSIIRKQLSLEGYAQESFIGDFSKYVSNIFNAFRNTSNFLEVKGFSKYPEQNTLSKENKAFINIVNSVPFTDLMKLSATSGNFASVIGKPFGTRIISPLDVRQNLHSVSKPFGCRHMKSES